MDRGKRYTLHRQRAADGRWVHWITDDLTGADVHRTCGPVPFEAATVDGAFWFRDASEAFRGEHLVEVNRLRLLAGGSPDARRRLEGAVTIAFLSP